MSAIERLYERAKSACEAVGWGIVHEVDIRRALAEAWEMGRDKAQSLHMDRNANPFEEKS